MVPLLSTPLRSAARLTEKSLGVPVEVHALSGAEILGGQVSKPRRLYPVIGVRGIHPTRRIEKLFHDHLMDAIKMDDPIAHDLFARSLIGGFNPDVVWHRDSFGEHSRQLHVIGVRLFEGQSVIDHYCEHMISRLDALRPEHIELMEFTGVLTRRIQRNFFYQQFIILNHLFGDESVDCTLPFRELRKGVSEEIFLDKPSYASVEEVEYIYRVLFPAAEKMRIQISLQPTVKVTAQSYYDGENVFSVQINRKIYKRVQSAYRSIFSE